MELEVQFVAAKSQFEIPAPTLVPAISEWVGWRRTPSGTYVAPAWASSVLGMGRGVILRWSRAATAARDRLLEGLNAARSALKGGILPLGLPGIPTEREPRRHQQQAVVAMRAMGWRVLLADDMGLGKTSTALWAANDAEATRILVVCPVSVKFNWQAEVAATLGGKWNTMVIDGGAKKRAECFADAQTLSLAGRLVVIINYDLLRHLPPTQLTWLHGFVKGELAIFDESHYLKSRLAERTKLCTELSSEAKHVFAMTGTPIRNLADDLFSQVEIVRPGTWSSYRDFAKRHLVIQAVKFGKRDVQKIVGTRNLDGLNAVMNTLQIARKKSEAVDLPPKIHTFPELQLEGDLLKIYKAMKEFARMQLNALLDAEAKMPIDAAPITIFDPRAKSAVEQAMRCEQIAQGFIGGIPDPVMQKLGASVLKGAEKIAGRPNELMFPHAPKIVWLLEAIESIIAQGGAPIVFSRFNAPMVWLSHHLTSQAGLKVGFLHGGLSAADKDEQVRSFQAGFTSVLLCQVRIAEGWNATRSQDVLFLGRDWSPAINAQAEDRAHRMGQKGTVNVQVPLTRGTIETMIDARLRAKGADAAQALRTVTIQELCEAL